MLAIPVLLAACAAPTLTSAPTLVAQRTVSANPTQTAGSTATVPVEATPTSRASLTPEFTRTPPLREPSWRERVDVAVGPSAREDHTWTLTDDGTVAYLFGGRGAAGSVLGDLWQFELFTGTWSELHPSGDAPASRFGHTATWVPGVGIVVWSGQGARFFDDIWVYDPITNAWDELPSLGVVPEARYGSCAALGPDTEMWISHGFTADDGRFADTWSYNFENGTWTNRTPTTGDLPVSRCLHDCFWSAGGDLVLYGGQTTGVTALGDLWNLDPANGWTRAPDPSPKPRNLYALARGENNGIVFGGGSVDGGFLGDTWIVGDAGEFSPYSVVGEAPPARSSATLIYSAPRDRYLLFGGMNADGVLDDVWELSPDT